MIPAPGPRPSNAYCHTHDDNPESFGRLPSFLSSPRTGARPKRLRKLSICLKHIPPSAVFYCISAELSTECLLESGIFLIETPPPSCIYCIIPTIRIFREARRHPGSRCLRNAGLEMRQPQEHRARSASIKKEASAKQRGDCITCTRQWWESVIADCTRQGARGNDRSRRRL